MIEQLKESLEEHKENVYSLDYMSAESIKNLYKHLIKEVDEALEGSQ